MTAVLTPTPALDVHEPFTLGELGVNQANVRDLALKTMFYAGRFSRPELADELKVSVAIVEEVLHTLSRDGFSAGLPVDHGEPHTYTLTERGYVRAEEALSRNSYVGPVPVSLSDYTRKVREQSVSRARLHRLRVEQALGSLVLNPATVRRVGWAVASHKPMLVYGASGNGKTTLAHTLGSIVGGTIKLPYAVEIAGQIVRVFDESKHRAAAPAAGVDSSVRAKGDRRWVEVTRPLVWAGGELRQDSLELTFDSDTRVYEAPLQLKANGGIFIVDDLGRQQIPAVQLLNRWILALESGVDHLTLHTGQVIEVPFDVLLLFSTNLPPAELADEAFLRRIRYKIGIENPSRDEFREIFVRECAAQRVNCDDDAFDYLLSKWYSDGRDIRGCHARDIIQAAIDIGDYTGEPLRLTADLVDEACQAYFL